MNSRVFYITHRCTLQKMIIIVLSEKQAENLSNILWDTQDEGPVGEGWASDELEELRGIIDDTIEKSHNQRIHLTEKLGK